MFKKLLFTSFLLFCSYITIYPSKKETTDFFNYCYSIEKIIFRNSLGKSNNLPKQILVEFDIRRKPSFKNKKILKQIHNLLLSKYDLIKINTK